ncbi:MAG: protein-glutamate O-methyltransferase CheR [Planctomycetota bacterium]|nr:protein-glutamate O-methyltransferase CheR [Planctomycetota bacterium]
MNAPRDNPANEQYQPSNPYYRSKLSTTDHDTIYLTNPLPPSSEIGIDQIPPLEFRELTALIARNFGIHIGQNKVTLLTGRMYPMLKKYNFASHRACIDAIKRDNTGELLSELVNRISTNHTAFYREEAHFRLLMEKVLPDLVEQKRRIGFPDIRIWCAACATGEEAYTIMFCLRKFLGAEYDKWQAGVLATDISAEALRTASKGIYNAARMEPVPMDVRLNCFNQLSPDSFEVKASIRREITFRRLNLVSDAFPFRKPFDIIFCRNVMIYFPRPLRENLMARLRDWLIPGGYLFIGHSESLSGLNDGYSYAAPAIYIRS